MKNIIGLTGPTGSGKSSFSRLAQEKGIAVIDCDKISREVTGKGTECLIKLSETFGEDILNNGELDRKLLASRAFASARKKAELEEIIFPFILQRVMEKIEESKEKNILLDAPTLFESGIDEMCGTVVAVLSPPDIRRKRIIERDSLTYEQAETRMNAGKPDEFYLEHSDYVINNFGTEDEFLNQCVEIIDIITEE